MVAQLPNTSQTIPSQQLLNFENNEQSMGSGAYVAFGKRALDVCFTLMAVPLVLTLLLPLLACIAIEGGRPFYSQMRVGRGGRSYRMWKLRTMVVGADEKLAEHLAKDPAAREEWNRTQKLKCDPRITRTGKFLRKTSIDELPQLFNVLIGDMSLIGPRPMMVSQKDLYPGQDYYDLRPGITGLWQISSRNESSFADRAKFDSTYKRDLSLRSDLRILVKTVTVVLKATGH